MSNLTKSINFVDIEILFKALDHVKLSLLETETQRLKADLQLLQILEELKNELLNFNPVK